MAIDKSKLPPQEDIMKIIIGVIDKKLGVNYGYDLYLPNIMKERCDKNNQQLGGPQNTQGYGSIMEAVSPLFYDAARELCRLGILRPGIKEHGTQSTDDGSAGNGYSVTPFGRQWLNEVNPDTFIPTEPGRFAEILEPYAIKFGDGFKQRANQAMRCYGAHAYLASCVMCGAAAESILLHLAITKEGSEEEVLKLYRTSSGRKKIEDIVIAQTKSNLKNEFEAFNALLKYRRDEAAHGRTSNISENESYISLTLLVRCAQFSYDHYETLTGKTL